MPIQHTIEPGDCISSLAFRHGLAIDTIWNDPANEALRAKRESPHVLQEGDVVTIPDRQPHFVAVTTGKRHVFRRRDVPERLRVCLLDSDGKPRAGVAYVVAFLKQEVRGTTGGDGTINVPIPPNLTYATLTVGDDEVYELLPGTLEPPDAERGLAARLANLGIGDDSGIAPASFVDPVWAFGVAMGVVDAAADPPENVASLIRDGVKQRHGS